MNTELNQAINAFKKIEQDTLSNLSAHPNMTEAQIKETCIKLIISLVWGFHYAFNAEIGGYEEEVLMTAGQTTIKADAVLCAQNGNIVCEYKAPSEDLNSHVAQALSYGKQNNALAVILTNGKEWRLYITGFDKKLNETPYRVFKLGEMSEDDYVDFVEIFKPKNTLDILKMRTEMNARKKTQEFENAKQFFANKLLDLMNNGDIEQAKAWAKEREGVASISNMEMDTRLGAYRAALGELKSNTANEAIAEYKRNQNLTNHLEADELATGKMAEVYAECHGHHGVHYEEGANSGASYIKNANGKTVLTIKGESTAENGWKFKGICFPGRNKTPSTLIPCNSVDDVKKHFETLLWVLDNIDRPDWADQWNKKFGTAA